ncbi:Serine/threonine-protein kinase ksp1 [Elsinoe australis]|uniref:non-specific serine/threonine protein kinase n=1 Tax=Elsinoe australis TaxID=40998 RepID=A0A2P7ZAL0_9PEZI|nr:Serine/threonine-protein kinase ksp1 [Elsinoe australis]
MACMQDNFKRDVILGGRFKTISPLNHGTFGMVFKARDLNTGDTVAVKCLTKQLPEGMQYPCPAAMAIDDHSEELEIHGHIGNHRNIVNLIDSFETEHHSYLVLEYCANGDLYEAIRAGKGPLETEHVRDFMLQLVKAVMCLHDKGIYHRDIKPENIFLTSDGDMKLGDFGLATTENWTNEYGVGSDRYMAPEQFDSTATAGYAPAPADIWAIGICLLNVLFGKNPFARPTHDDPLFADYVHDRQSLFDVFPNMSQDTYNVLVHCLALDPTRRSLTGVRDALQNVVSFTTDDESLDEFCSGNDTVGATQGREPLRTPSVTSPQMDNNTSFPWAKALQTSPQKHQRQLSVIQDAEEMFPAPSKKSFEPDVASLNSALDSGIGMSYKSSNVSSAPIGVPFSTSLPTHRAMASVYSKDHEIFSKSWSDLWEEEEEEKQRSSFDLDEDRNYDLSPYKLEESLITRSSTPAIDIKPSSRGSSTPRMGLSELGNANSRSQSPSLPRIGQFSFGHFAKSAPQKDGPLKRTGSSLMDKWAQLGNLRRTNNTTAPQTPRQVTGTNTPTKPTPATNTKRSKTRDRAGSWRKNATGGSPYNNERWNMSKDWRSPQQPNYTTDPSNITPSKPRSPSFFTQTRRKSPRRGHGATNDDIGDLEWVGGWQDLHL